MSVQQFYITVRCVSHRVVMVGRSSDEVIFWWTVEHIGVLAPRSCAIAQHMTR